MPKSPLKIFQKNCSDSLRKSVNRNSGAIRNFSKKQKFINKAEFFEVGICRSEVKFDRSPNLTPHLKQSDKNNQQTKDTSLRTSFRKKVDEGSFDSDGKIVIYGKHPVYEVIKARKRKLFSIYATPQSFEDLKLTLSLNSAVMQMVKMVDATFIDHLCGKDKVHQGLAVIASKIVPKSQYELLSELNSIAKETQKPTILILDELTDSHNVGAIIRSAVAFGVHKIVLCAHNAVFENSTVIKSSAGMSEHVELFVISGINNLIKKLKELDYWCVGLAGEGELKIKSLKDYRNIALIVGSEGTGLRKLVRKNCDFLLAIKMNERVESLNVSVATSIALHEIYYTPSSAKAS